MELTGTQKKLQIVFRVIIFITTLIAISALTVYISFSGASKATHSAYFYKTAMQKITVLCYLYYSFLAAMVICVIFSLINCKCTSAAATVGRTIAIAGCLIGNIIPIKYYKFLHATASYYLEDSYYTTDGVSLSDYYDAQDMAYVSIIVLLIATAVFVVLSITSIVALTRKVSNGNYYSQQSQYSMNGAYNNMYNNGAYNGNQAPYGTQPQYNNVQAGMNNQPQYNNIQAGMNNQPQYNNVQAGMNNQPQYNNIQAGMNNQPQYDNSQVGMNNQPQYDNGQADMNAQPQYQSNNSYGNERKIIGYNPQTGEPVYSDTQNEN